MRLHKPNHLLLHLPLGVAMIISLFLGVFIAAVCLEEWERIVYAAKFFTLFVTIALGGPSIWMLSFTPLPERILLQSGVLLAVMMAIFAIFPQFNALMSLLYLVPIIAIIVSIFIVAYNSYKALKLKP